ncbi:MAG TPA: hypothetical protein VEV15_11540 [Flavisolibacter sp.]|nr:hypothetical protein [Flavisolibacter sp.]
MIDRFPVSFVLKDGTNVVVKQPEEGCYAFHLTRLNSEKHNFIWKEAEDEIEESYETRFDTWQNEAVALFKNMLRE